MASFSNSTTTEAKLLKLVGDGMLQPQILLQWRAAADESTPTPQACEVVVFEKFVQHGLGFPACDFLRGLLHFYQIELLNLNPNSILQIVIFVHFCEVFLSISPNADLFKHYFFIKPYPSSSHQNPIGELIGRLARVGTSFMFRINLL